LQSHRRSHPLRGSDAPHQAEHRKTITCLLLSDVVTVVNSPAAKDAAASGLCRTGEL
jgi:hypothetical protein